VDTSDICLRTSWYCRDIRNRFGRSTQRFLATSSWTATISLPLLFLTSASRVHAVCAKSKVVSYITESRRRRTRLAQVAPDEVVYFIAEAVY